jgi:hypothetical protein
VCVLNTREGQIQRHHHVLIVLMTHGDVAIRRVVSMRGPMAMRFAVTVDQQGRDTRPATGLCVSVRDRNQRQSAEAERQVHGKDAADSHLRVMLCEQCRGRN